MPLSELAGMGYTAQVLEHQARLSLYGPTERDEEAVATVREEHSWVAGAAASGAVAELMCGTPAARAEWPGAAFRLGAVTSPH